LIDNHSRAFKTTTTFNPHITAAIHHDLVDRAVGKEGIEDIETDSARSDSGNELRDNIVGE
jgi:hypothetical protein